MLFCLRSGELVDLILGHSDMMSRNYLVRPDPRGAFRDRAVAWPAAPAPDENGRCIAVSCAAMPNRSSAGCPPITPILAPPNARHWCSIASAGCAMRHSPQLDQIETQVEWELRGQGQPHLQQADPEVKTGGRARSNPPKTQGAPSGFEVRVK